MTQLEILNLIKEFIADRQQMVLATYGDHPWIATLYFATDKDLNIYFLSNPETLHCRQLETNSKVAISIADSPQDPASPKKGIQIFGLAKRIKDDLLIKEAVDLWCQTLGVKSKDYFLQGITQDKIKGRMYKVSPKKIKFLNQELWEEGQERTLNV